ncbi:TonB-dependent receptor domain-containing protein [Chitinimonas lacunae]|uniref:TonB-dependent receptor domain-containing protein n=1 Tax=Chitinimonas lacunae TaxID=1963018 RepID=A0ABV8MMW2_9NEIS
MNSPVLLRPLLLAFTACPPTLATSDSLETVVVTATRTATPQHQVAASVSRVEGEEFVRRQASTVGEVLQDLPNVDFGGGPRAAGRVPTIRGFSGREITVLVDGVRLNAASGLHSPLYIDPFLLEGAEVLRGASSSLYGNGGLGGVLSLRTLSARERLSEEESHAIQWRAGVDSGDLSKRVQTRVDGRSGNLDGVAALAVADWDRIRQGAGRTLRPNAGRSANGLLTLAYGWDARTRLHFSHRAYRESVLRPNNPQADVALGGPGQVPVQRHLTRQVQTSLGATVGDTEAEPAFSVGLYHTELDQQAEANPDFNLRRSATLTETVGGHLFHSLRLEEGGRHHRISYGFDVYRDRQHADDDGQPNPVLPAGRQTVYGAFLQDEVELNASLQLIASVRQDRYRTGPTDTSGRLSPKLTLTGAVGRDGRLYASYAEAYRAPSLSESGMSLSGSQYLFNFVPNPALRPEIDRGVEAGFHYRRRGWLAEGDRLRIQGALFRSRVEDLISTAVIGRYTRSAPFSGTGLIFQSRNEAQARRHGAELEAAYRRGAWELAMAYSRLRVRNRDSGESLFAPPDKLVLTLDWHGEQLDASWRARFVAAQNDDATVARRTAGYGVHDLFLRWRWAGHDRLRLDAAIGNLFDKHYVVYQSANPSARTAEMGRAYRLAISAGF